MAEWLSRFFYFQIEPHQPLLNNRIRGMCDAHSPIRIKHYEQTTYGTETTGEIFQRFTHLYTDTGLPSDFTRTTYTPAGRPSNETAWTDGTLSVRNKCPAMAGHLLRTESVPSVQAVSLEGLPAGVYVVRVKSEGRPVSVYKCVNR